MTPRHSPPLVLAVVAIVALVSSLVQSQQPQVKVPDAGVPEIMTLEGNFVRGAYNNEGYAILGYRAANQSVGEEWMLLETGMTVRDGRSNFTLTRDALSLTTPDQKTIPLPSNAEYHQVDLRALEQRASVIRDSINYFPPSATRSCRIGFFAEVSSRAMAYDQVELSSQRGCIGRLYFKIPGGIQYGQHFLNIKFKESTVRVPFRILTKDEEKFLSKNFKDIRKQVEAAFKPKTKTN
jgi:hypothetical protein